MNKAVAQWLIDNPTHVLRVDYKSDVNDWFAVVYQFGGMFVHSSGPSNGPAQAMDNLGEEIAEYNWARQRMDTLYRNGTLISTE
jgi:hypothetical protein